ncbi:MAG: hypothetical protein Q8Q15_01970 [bacterium]|nr:hypothetical protein [bacterium]
MVYAVNIGDIYEPAKTFPTVGSLISVLLPNVFILAGVVFFLLLIFGGFGLIMGAGGGDPQKTGQGKQAITAAVIGFLVIFLSYWIIKIIEVVTGLKIF